MGKCTCCRRASLTRAGAGGGGFHVATTTTTCPHTSIPPSPSHAHPHTSLQHLSLTRPPCLSPLACSPRSPRHLAERASPLDFRSLSPPGNRPAKQRCKHRTLVLDLASSTSAPDNSSSVQYVPSRSFSLPLSPSVSLPRLSGGLPGGKGGGASPACAPASTLEPDDGPHEGDRRRHSLPGPLLPSSFVSWGFVPRLDCGYRLAGVLNQPWRMSSPRPRQGRSPRGWRKQPAFRPSQPVAPPPVSPRPSFLPIAISVPVLTAHALLGEPY